MRVKSLVIAAAFAVGFGTAASASPLPANASETLLPPETAVEYTKKGGWKGGGWKGGHPGRHYGWKRGRHLGWYKKGRHRGVRYF